ncbi:hypothetical protein KR093_003593 [Drosophila rubida]|uniref:Uncharacterized protein n=1 Tax=Drosophila rubida TaxID=30044 RepID=A0AAD4PJX6_9MUSC|nr:hypothetical protein KR093_003593 [Drosophila rubida]
MLQLRSDVYRAHFNPMNPSVTLDSTAAFIEQIERRTEFLKHHFCRLQDNLAALQETVNQEYCENMEVLKAHMHPGIMMPAKKARRWKKRLSLLLLQDDRKRKS